jgi:hypothetical protein
MSTNTVRIGRGRTNLGSKGSTKKTTGICVTGLCYDGGRGLVTKGIRKSCVSVTNASGSSILGSTTTAGTAWGEVINEFIMTITRNTCFVTILDLYNGNSGTKTIRVIQRTNIGRTHT